MDMEIVDASYKDKYDGYKTVEQYAVVYFLSDYDRLFEDGTNGWKRNGREWRRPSDQYVLDRDVYWWLRENVGINDVVWEWDRHFYEGEARPPLDQVNFFKDSVSYYDGSFCGWARWRHHHNHREYAPKARGVIIFQSKDDAEKFVARWG